MAKTRWTPMTHKYSNGENLILGRVPVGRAFYSANLSKGDAASWDWCLDLPGKERAGRRLSSMVAAREACEAALEDWLQAAGLSNKSEE